jgi:hypothetical protein
MISQLVQFSTDNKEFTTHKHMVIRKFTAFRGTTTHTNWLTGHRNAPASEDELPAGMVEGAHRNGRILHWSTNPWKCSPPTEATGNFLPFQQQQQSTG